jgi:hypothetical protein
MRNARRSGRALYGVVVKALSLALFIAGLLSSDLDALQNHSPERNVTNAHPENGSTHIVRLQATEKPPPCNACFFRNLVGHSLIPQKIELEAVRTLSQLFNTLNARSFQSFFSKEESRGPPR